MVGAQRLDSFAFCMLVNAILCVLGHWQAGSRTRSLQWVETIFMLMLVLAAFRKVVRLMLKKLSFGFVVLIFTQILIFGKDS